MSKFREYFDNDTAKFFLVLAIFLSLFLISDYIGFSATGFEDLEVVRTRNFYFNSALVSSLILLIGYFFIIARKDGDKEYGRGNGFASPGKKPHLPFFKRMSILQISWLFLIITLLLGFLNFNGAFGTQTTYTGVGTLSEAQQFTPGQSLLYSTILVPIAENLPAAALFILLTIILGFIARKQNWSYGAYFSILLISSFILGGIYGYGMHQIVYSGSDISLTKVFWFWSIGLTLTALTGVFTVFWEMHLVNNLFVALSSGILSPDLINIYSGIAILGLGIGYALKYRGRLFG